jgi:hypothetical protein
MIKQLKGSEVPALRAKLLEEQSGVCPICSGDVNSPCLDHEHTKKIKGSGQVRGVICRMCNVFLGKIENNCVRYGIGLFELPRVLRNVADYVQKDPLPYMHPSEAPKAPKLKKTSYNKLKKAYDGRAKFPEYPKQKKLTKGLKALFEKYGIEPEYYK